MGVGSGGRGGGYNEMDTGKRTQRDETTRPGPPLHWVAASCMVVHEKVVGGSTTLMG